MAGGQEARPNHSDIGKAAACVTPAHIPLAKASHMATSNIYRVGKTPQAQEDRGQGQREGSTVKKHIMYPSQALSAFWANVHCRVLWVGLCSLQKIHIRVHISES